MAEDGLEADDAAAIEAIRAGRTEAFQAIIEKYQRKVFRLVYQVSGGKSDVMEDHAQEIFMRVFRGIARFQGGAALGTWIHRIAINYLIGESRRRQALKRKSVTLSLDAPMQTKGGEFVPEVGDGREDPSRHVLNEEKGAVIRREIQALEEDLRRIILLREVEQMSYEEIAEVVDIPIGTVRSRLHRARGILQERLEHLL